MSVVVTGVPLTLIRLGGLWLVLLATSAHGQGTPLPLPGGPSGASPPIFSEPSPTPRKIESPQLPASTPSPEVPATPAAPGGAATERAKGEVGAPQGATTPSNSRVPQLTTFPELMRGLGNSQRLLED